jgi:hypothetical protein
MRLPGFTAELCVDAKPTDYRTTKVPDAQRRGDEVVPQLRCIVANHYLCCWADDVYECTPWPQL